MSRWKDVKKKMKEILKEIFRQPIGIASLIMMGIMVTLAVGAPWIAGTASYTNWQNYTYWEDNPAGVPPAWVSWFGIKYTTTVIKKVSNPPYSEQAYPPGIPSLAIRTYYANFTTNYTAQVPYTNLIIYIYPQINWTILGRESFSDLISLVQNKTLIRTVIAGYVMNITNNVTKYSTAISGFLKKYQYVLEVCEKNIKTKIVTATTSEKSTLEGDLAQVKVALEEISKLKAELQKVQEKGTTLLNDLSTLKTIKPPKTYQNATDLAKTIYGFSESLLYLEKAVPAIYNNITKHLLSETMISIGNKYYGRGFNLTIVKSYNTTIKPLAKNVKNILDNISAFMNIPQVSAVVSDVETFKENSGATGTLKIVLKRPDGITITVLGKVTISPTMVNRIDVGDLLVSGTSTKVRTITNTFKNIDPYHAIQIDQNMSLISPFRMLFVKWPHYPVEYAIKYLEENLTVVYQQLKAVPSYERTDSINVTLKYIPVLQQILAKINSLPDNANITALWYNFSNIFNGYLVSAYDQLMSLMYPQVENATPYLTNALSWFSIIENEVSISTSSSIIKGELYSAIVFPVMGVFQAMENPVPLHGTYTWSIQMEFKGKYSKKTLQKLVIEYATHKISKIPPPPIATNIEKVVTKELGSSYGLLGTDVYGRDLWKGFVWGTRAALIVGLIVSVLTAIIGLIYGSISGYVGGITDEVMQRIVEIMVTLPFFPILIMIGYSMHGGITYWMVALLLVIFSWAGLARVIRSMALQIKEYTFVEAARCLGASTGRILVKHVMPQMLPYLFANMAFAVPGAIITVASLAFLGVGDIIHPTWGSILHAAQENGAVLNNQWWWVIPPGIGMMIIGLAFVFLGMALDRVLNPRLRRL